MKTCYFTFGRFNPPTIGHEKLLRTLEKQAASNDYLIYPSQTFKKPNNPLPYDYKVKTLKKTTVIPQNLKPRRMLKWLKKIKKVML